MERRWVWIGTTNKVWMSYAHGSFLTLRAKNRDFSREDDEAGGLLGALNARGAYRAVRFFIPQRGRAISDPSNSQHLRTKATKVRLKASDGENRVGRRGPHCFPQPRGEVGSSPG